jgi:hypothetical protein
MSQHETTKVTEVSKLFLSELELKFGLKLSRRAGMSAAKLDETPEDCWLNLNFNNSVELKKMLLAALIAGLSILMRIDSFTTG